jgi:hypothetical protein
MTLVVRFKVRPGGSVPADRDQRAALFDPGERSRQSKAVCLRIPYLSNVKHNLYQGFLSKNS